MLNFLGSIVDFLQMISDNVRNVVEGTAQMFIIIPKCMGVLNYVYAYIPSALVAFAMAGIGICVVLHFLGR